MNHQTLEQKNRPFRKRPVSILEQLMQTRETYHARDPRDTPFFLIFRLLFAFCIIAGCYNLALNAKQGSYTTQQKRTDQIYSGLESGQPLIQSFQADRAYFSTLVFYASLLKNEYSGVNIIVRLRHTGADKDLAARQFFLGRTGQQEMLTFSFPPLEHSKDTTYEFVIESSLPAGSVGIWGSAEDDYGDGTLIQADKPLSFDLSFFTYYRTPILEMLNIDNLRFFFQMGMMFVFYLIIGFPFLLLFSFMEHQTWLDVLAALFSMSAAFLPILFALMSFTSIQINMANLAWIFIALFALTFLAFLGSWKFLGHRPQFAILEASPPTRDWFFWSVAAILVYALLARAAQASGLYVPNWIDGLVHQRSLDKILETGSQPTSQIYHAGFYSHVVLTSILTGSSTPEAMLVCGQLFNALGGLTFLVLASRFLSSRFALLISAAAYWFLAPFPSYLLTWSRFPLVLGLLLLPSLITYSKDILRTAKWQLVFPITLIFTGMLLIHYGTAIIFLTFVAACLLVDSEARSGLTRLGKTFGWRLLPILIGLLLPALLALGPKLVRFFFDETSRQSVVALSQEAASQIDTLHILKLTAQNGGILVWIMATVGIFIALGYARKSMFLLLSWYLLLALTTWVQLQVWGIAVSSYTNLIISTSIPLSILAGFSAETLFAPTRGLMSLFEKIHLKPYFLATPGLLVIILAGSYSQWGTVNPISVLFNERDSKATQWIRENTPARALILVDSFRWGQTYWPSDGGGWLKPLTGRQFIYARSEKDISNIDALITSQKVQFIYLGQGYGELTKRHFLENSNYSIIYNVQGISIFAVKDGP